MALKPEIQFDDQVKENVGLNQDADLKFVKDNPNPSPQFLPGKWNRRIADSLECMAVERIFPMGRKGSKWRAS